MYHSLTFSTGTISNGKLTGVNTWDNWHLIPTSRPVFTLPNVETKYVDVDGREGSIDITNYLNSQTVIRDRSGSFEFYITNRTDGEYFRLQSEIAAYLRGRRLWVSLEDDPNYYYIGRFNLESWKQDDHFSQVTIKYRVAPYKYRVTNSNSKAL